MTTTPTLGKDRLTRHTDHLRTSKEPKTQPILRAVTTGILRKREASLPQIKSKTRDITSETKNQFNLNLSSLLQDSENIPAAEILEKLDEESIATENEESIFELIPSNIKQEHLINPELFDQQQLNINIFKNEAAKFALRAQEYSEQGNALDLSQAQSIHRAYSDMLSAAKRIVECVDESIFEGNWRKLTIDFFTELKLHLHKNFPVHKIHHELDSISKTLKDLLIFDVNSIHYVDVKHLVDLNKDDPCFQKSKGKNNREIEKKSKEIKILEHYRKTLSNLAFYLKNSNKILILSNPLYIYLINKIDVQITKVLPLIKKHDKKDVALGLMFTDSENVEQDFKLFIYKSISQIIQAKLIGIFYFKATKEKLQELIRLYAYDLKKSNQRNEFFYDECLDEFERCLSTQKYNEEILIWWRRMVAAGSVCYYDENRKILLEPKKIEEPEEDDVEGLTRYNTQLGEYIAQSTNLLSTYAFQDPTFLQNFFIIALSLSKKMPNLPQSNDILDSHAKIFRFLESLESDKYDLILKEFNDKLRISNKATINRLESKSRAFEKPCLGVEIVISFILRFYRSVGDRYITVPLGNIIQLSKIAYPDYDDIIKAGQIRLDESLTESQKLMQVKKRVYIHLESTSYTIRSVCKQEINPGPGIEETYCNLFTVTHIREAYPGEWATYPKYIEFAFERRIPLTLNSSYEENENIESRVNEKLRRLISLVHALGFPDVVERFEK